MKSFAAGASSVLIFFNHMNLYIIKRLGLVYSADCVIDEVPYFILREVKIMEEESNGAISKARYKAGSDGLYSFPTRKWEKFDIMPEVEKIISLMSEPQKDALIAGSWDDPLLDDPKYWVALFVEDKAWGNCQDWQDSLTDILLDRICDEIKNLRKPLAST